MVGNLDIQSVLRTDSAIFCCNQKPDQKCLGKKNSRTTSWNQEELLFWRCGFCNDSKFPKSKGGYLGGGFKYFFFIPIWGVFPFWLIFFRWVETTNQVMMNSGCSLFFFLPKASLRRTYFTKFPVSWREKECTGSCATKRMVPLMLVDI